MMQGELTIGAHAGLLMRNGRKSYWNKPGTKVNPTAHEESKRAVEKKLPARLPTEELTRLRATLAGAGMALRDGGEALARLEEYRAMYEPYVWALSDFLLSPLPSWLPAQGAIDDWESSPEE